MLSTAARQKRETLSIERSIALGLRLVGSVEQYALSLGVSGFDVDLPPIAGSAADQSHLNTVPPLYLAAELEAADFLPAVETYAGLFASGGIAADLGPAMQLVVEFWRGRNQRFTRDERRAFFARLFGDTSGPALAVPGGRNTQFEDLMINLTEALYKLNPVPAIEQLLHQGIAPASEVSLQLAAESLVENLLPRSGGMAAYAAHDLLNTIQQALEILKQPAVQQSVGAKSVWGAVANIVESYLHEAADIDSHVRRGQSGMAVLAWLAGTAPNMDNRTTFQLDPNSDVVGAATAWLESSLTLREGEAAAAPAGTQGG